jgi:putative FmdB family regulatory protein
VPTYDYLCKKNGHRFEVLQRMSDDAIAVCEVCGGPAQRVLHAPAIHFKGSGFHNTDYGTKKRPREDSTAATGNGASSSDGGGSSDAGSASSDAPKVKEATPKDTAVRATGP